LTLLLHLLFWNWSLSCRFFIINWSFTLLLFSYLFLLGWGFSLNFWSSFSLNYFYLVMVVNSRIMQLHLFIY